jgi:hypothetical protein
MQGVFYGVGAAVIAIIARSVQKLTKITLGKDPLLWIVFVGNAAVVSLTQSEIVWVFVASGLWAAQLNASSEPFQDARTVAGAVGGLVARDFATGESAELSTVLRAMASGELRVQGSSTYYPSGSVAPSFQRVAYIVVVGAGGQALASSDPSGASFTPPERSEWAPLVRAALSGTTSSRRLTAVRSGAGPAALGAYPVLDAGGHRIAAIIVGTSAMPPPSGAGSFWQRLALFGAASVGVLAVASLFALIPAGVVGYFLGRQKLEARPLWWMPLGVAIAAVLNGTFTFLRGTAVSTGISGPLTDLGPWIGLGLAAVLAIAVTVALSALIRRQLVIGLSAPPPAAAPGSA